MGQRRDTVFRQKNIRENLSLFILEARDIIYKKAFAIGSAAVNWLLKETSAVPTIVLFFAFFLGIEINTFEFRTLSSTFSKKTLVFPVC